MSPSPSRRASSHFHDAPLIVQPRAARAPAPAGTTPLHVLVLDGDAAAGARLARWFHHHGYAVALACHITEAATMLRTATFDLIVADVELLGPGAMRWVEETCAQDTYPPIILTPARVSLQLAARCAKLPLAGYLPKPVDHTALRALLQRMFGPATH